MHKYKGQHWVHARSYPNRVEQRCARTKQKEYHIASPAHRCGGNNAWQAEKGADFSTERGRAWFLRSQENGVWRRVAWLGSCATCRADQPRNVPRTHGERMGQHHVRNKPTQERSAVNINHHCYLSLIASSIVLLTNSDPKWACQSTLRSLFPEQVSGTCPGAP